jgi:phosphonatase-like hydrolase
MQEIKLVVFDLAGTVIEDAGQVPAAFTAALQSHGIEITSDSLREVRGASKREAIQRFVACQPGVSNADILAHTERVYNSFRSTLAEMFGQDGVREIAGATETLAWLKRRGIQIALNTGFDRTITELLLNSMPWGEVLIDAVVCGDDVARGRPAPYLIFHAMEKCGVTSVQQVANVGDTVLDLQAGQNAGVRYNIGVLSGAHSRGRLEREQHTHLLSSVAVLPTLWK